MLDSLTRFELQEVLIKLWRRDKKTALLITHDVDEALFLSDRIVMMTSGPEARVGDILEVTFPRPRNRREVMAHPDYYRLREHLISFLEEHAHRPQPAPASAQPPAPDGNDSGASSKTGSTSSKTKSDTLQPQLV